MAVSKLPTFQAPCKPPGLSAIHIGPRLHLRLCGELIELAQLHEKLTRDLQSVEARFEALLALVEGSSQ
jgi:hypothetical protein